MKRRGFLGFLGGGVVAGPGVVKEAAANLADLRIGPRKRTKSPFGLWPEEQIRSIDDHSGDKYAWEKKEIEKFARRTKEEHDFYRARTEVFQLDPDIASYRSIALHMKISMQRNRIYTREIERETENLLKRISGWFE